MTSLDDIAVTIDRDGFEAVDRHTIDDVIALATTADASPVLAEVFGDEHEPAPVRERAFGLLAMQIGSSAEPSPRRVRRLGRNRTGSVQSTPCNSSTTRSRRSRVPVPASGADSRSHLPNSAPILH